LSSLAALSGVTEVDGAGHDWLRVVAVAVEAVELMPGDPSAAAHHGFA